LKLWDTFHEKARAEPIGSNGFDLFHVRFPVTLEYVDSADSYPFGWTNSQGKTVQSKISIQETYQALKALYDEGLTLS
jgi:D-xylose reductase